MQSSGLIAMAVLLVLAVVEGAKKCPTCDPESCPKLNTANCLAGTTKDDCDCCDICAKLEGQTCQDQPRDTCGDGLECVQSSRGLECQCQYQEVLCGTDGNTYNNLCQLMTTAVREKKTNSLEVKSVGPCDSGARIITKPEYVRNHTNSNVVLQCEAMGLPTPSMAWIFTRADNKTYNLPGDDNKIVSSARGGPGNFMVTTWLQIEGLQKVHEGDYTCIAFNQHKTDKATARIKVVVP